MNLRGVKPSGAGMIYSHALKTAARGTAARAPRLARVRHAHVAVGAIKIDEAMKAFVETRVLPGTGVEAEAMWAGFAALVTDLAPQNKRLLQERDTIQAKIDAYLKQKRDEASDGVALPAPVRRPTAEYKSFLTSIGYLVPAGPPFTIESTNVDPEICAVPGPQLVCPVDNARFIVNAANARWGR